MKKYRVKITLMPRKTLLDPQGQAVEQALKRLGFKNVDEVRVGKSVVVTLKASNEQEAIESAQKMCEKLLANPITEEFDVEIIQ